MFHFSIQKVFYEVFDKKNTCGEETMDFPPKAEGPLKGGGTPEEVEVEEVALFDVPLPEPPAEPPAEPPVPAEARPDPDWPPTAGPLAISGACYWRPPNDVAGGRILQNFLSEKEKDKN